MQQHQQKQPPPLLLCCAPACLGMLLQRCFSTRAAAPLAMPAVAVLTRPPSRWRRGPASASCACWGGPPAGPSAAACQVRVLAAAALLRVAAAEVASVAGSVAAEAAAAVGEAASVAVVSLAAAAA